MQVESRLRFSISASAVNARNMVSNVPSSRHLANRAYTDCQGPYASGNSRHCAPLRTIQSIPLSIFRSSFRGRPRFPVLPAGSNFFTRSHCAFVNSYRFMALFSHFYLVCAIFIFQTSPRRDKKVRTFLSLLIRFFLSMLIQGCLLHFWMRALPTLGGKQRTSALNN